MCSKLVCLLTGLADVPLDDLEGKTPLQVAHHPTLDRMAQEGSCFTVQPKGGVEASIAALCGHVGTVSRSSLAAEAMGHPLQPGEHAYCVRLVSIGKDIVVDVSDDLVSEGEAKALFELLGQKLPGRFLPIEGAQGLLITNAPALSRGDAHHLSPAEVVGRAWNDLLPGRQAEPFVARANQILASHEVNTMRAELEELPVNGIYLSHQGEPLSHQNLAQNLGLYTQFFPSKGLGIPLWDLPPSKTKYGVLEEIVRTIDEQPYETMVVELGYLWKSTYKGDLLEKVKTIEWLDRYFLKPLLEKEIELLVMPLQTTDIRWGRTTAGSVPAVFYPGEGAKLPRFDEVSFLDGGVDQVGSLRGDLGSDLPRFCRLPELPISVVLSHLFE